MSNRLIISSWLILSFFICLVTFSSPVNASDNMMWFSYGYNRDIGSSVALGVLFNTDYSFGSFKLLGGINFGTDFSGNYGSSDYKEIINDGEYLIPGEYTNLGLQKINGVRGGDLLLGLQLGDFLNIFIGGGYYYQKYVKLAKSKETGILYAMDKPTYESTWTNTYGAQLLFGKRLLLGYEKHSYRGEHYQLGMYGSF